MSSIENKSSSKVQNRKILDCVEFRCGNNEQLPRGKEIVKFLMQVALGVLNHDLQPPFFILQRRERVNGFPHSTVSHLLLQVIKKKGREEMMVQRPVES